MLKINNKEFAYNLYPDQSALFKLETWNLTTPIQISWQFENNEELVILQLLVAHLHEHGRKDIILKMPYIPYARHDRAPSEHDVLLLKHFSSIINGLNLERIDVLDPHSSVSQNLFDRIHIEQPTRMIEHVMTELAKKDNIPITLFFPDEGAMKRYGSVYKQKYCFGIKKRDWDTGEILGLELAGHTHKISGHPILIIDDICSAGGTFHYAAQELKKRGAGNIYLWVTHCEETIHNGRLLMDNSLIEHIYTTNSLKRTPHKKITEVHII